jgi:hypothetical protein
VSIILDMLVRKFSFSIKKKILVPVRKDLSLIELPLNSSRRLVLMQGS